MGYSSSRFRSSYNLSAGRAPLGAVIGAAALATTTGIAGYNIQKEKEGQLPVSFSEIEHTIQQFKTANKTVPSLTLFYSVTNDVTMKVFESTNLALAKDESHDSFARELEKRINPALKEHTLISEYAQQMPKIAADATATLSPLTVAQKGLPAVVHAFEQAWSESHWDHYSTEYYTDVECDSEGSCTNVRKSREVYDYTDHSYRYDRQEGIRAAALLNSFKAGRPDLEIDENLYYARRTHTENEGAMKTALAKQLKNRAPTADEYLAFANTWAVGSNYTKYMPEVRKHYKGLTALAPEWDAVKNTARSRSYRTYSRFDSGPSDFRIAEGAENSARQTVAAAAKITEGVEFAAKNIPLLEQKIHEYVAVVLDGAEGNPKKLRAEIMDLSRDIYNKNFAGGHNVNGFNWPMVLVLGFAGLLAGGFGGAGIGRGSELLQEVLAEQAARKRWDPPTPKEPQDRPREKESAPEENLTEKTLREMAQEKPEAPEGTEDVKPMDTPPQEPPAKKTPPKHKIEL